MKIQTKMSWYIAKKKNGGFCFVDEDQEKTGPVKDVKAHTEIGMVQVNTYIVIYEPHREKTGLLPMRKQRRKSASR